MDKRISLLTVEQEIRAALEYCKENDYEISEINQDDQFFTVLMQSPIDQEKYLIRFEFVNYPEQPYLIDFLDPATQNINPDNYPISIGDSFFHPNGAICNPCNRKAYKGYTGLHQEWEFTDWKTLAGSLITLKAILMCIDLRISKTQFYGGKRKK